MVIEFTQYITADWIQTFLFLKDFRANSCKYLQERGGAEPENKAKQIFVVQDFWLQKANFRAAKLQPFHSMSNVYLWRPLREKQYLVLDL